jgi:hypothetical protein
MSHSGQETRDNGPAAGGGLPEPPAGLKPGVPRVDPAKDSHWLTRPGTVRLLWWIFGVVLGLTVLLQLAVPVKGKFALESTFAFGAWYGFGACVAMVLVARVLGWWLKRPDDYYAEDIHRTRGGEGDDA